MCRPLRLGRARSLLNKNRISSRCWKQAVKHSTRRRPTRIPGVIVVRQGFLGPVPSFSQAPDPCEWVPDLGRRSHRGVTPEGRPRRGACSWTMKAEEDGPGEFQACSRGTLQGHHRDRHTQGLPVHVQRSPRHVQPGISPDVDVHARWAVTASVSVQGSYLGGSHNLATGSSGGGPGRVVVRCRCCHFCCHRPSGRRWVMSTPAPSWVATSW
jgi:hypothetical protein